MRDQSSCERTLTTSKEIGASHIWESTTWKEELTEMEWLEKSGESVRDTVTQIQETMQARETGHDRKWKDVVANPNTRRGEGLCRERGTMDK